MLCSLLTDLSNWCKEIYHSKYKDEFVFQEDLHEQLSMAEALKIIGIYEGQISFGGGARTTIKGIQSREMAKILEACINVIAPKASALKTVQGEEYGVFEFSCSDYSHDLSRALMENGIKFEGSKYIKSNSEVPRR